MKLREYFLYTKKKPRFIQQFVSSVSIAAFWRISLNANCARCSVSATTHGYVCHVCFPFDLNENSASVWRSWHRTACTVCVQRYSPKCSYADRGDELLNKVMFFPLRIKSILVASYRYGWTTDGRWTILTMFFILLTVLITRQSMGQSQASWFSSKIS